jgi:hypothetical protein
MRPQVTDARCWLEQNASSHSEEPVGEIFLEPVRHVDEVFVETSDC